MTPTKPKTTEKASKETYNYGTGRRKSAVARVRVYDGTGSFSINDKEQPLDARLTQVLDLVGKTGKVNITVRVAGGGVEGQMDAIRHGLARALLEMNSELRATLKKAGFLTRDPREKERKKYGLHGARRGPQFSKR
jgi:small subunit ribosomal protein S9